MFLAYKWAKMLSIYSDIYERTYLGSYFATATWREQTTGVGKHIDNPCCEQYNSPQGNDEGNIRISSLSDPCEGGTVH
jgi:hypothetical protein